MIGFERGKGGGGGGDYSMAKLHGKTMLLAKKRIECDLLKHGFAWGIFYMSFFFFPIWTRSTQLKAYTLPRCYKSWLVPQGSTSYIPIPSERHICCQNIIFFAKIHRTYVRQSKSFFRTNWKKKKKKQFCQTVPHYLRRVHNAALMIISK